MLHLSTSEQIHQTTCNSSHSHDFVEVSGWIDVKGLYYVSTLETAIAMLLIT